jgi:large subunit ribosomal protein L22
MTGPKLNEASMVAGERSGTKASALYLRVSASKARVVLNLIRGVPVKRADEVLQFSDREVSNDIRKVLASAVANAQHNDEQDPDELFVKACFADEGPTLKRFTPRARGRGSRINKRTCHITIVLGRLDDTRLEVVQAREAKRTAAGRRRPAAGGTSAGRRARVERSRQRAAQARGETPKQTQDRDDHEGHDHADAEVVDEVEETLVEDVDAGAEGSASDAAQAARGESEADDESAAQESDVTESADESASDEAQASRGKSEADDEGAV